MSKKDVIKTQITYEEAVKFITKKTGFTVKQARKLMEKTREIGPILLEFGRYKVSYNAELVPRYSVEDLAADEVPRIKKIVRLGNRRKKPNILKRLRDLFRLW